VKNVFLFLAQTYGNIESYKGKTAFEKKLMHRKIKLIRKRIT